MFKMAEKSLSLKDYKKLQKQLAKYLNEAADMVEFATFKASVNIENRARNMIQSGGRTGWVYDWEVDLPGKKGDEPSKNFLGWWLAPNGRWLPLKKRAKPHTASAPGEPPHTDTGGLASSLASELVSKAPNPSSRVGSTVDYGLYLEKGTQHMEARPYLDPATDEEMPVYIDAIIAALEKAKEKAKRS